VQVAPIAGHCAGDGGFGLHDPFVFFLIGFWIGVVCARVLSPLRSWVVFWVCPGYDKRTDADTINRLHQAAMRLVPALGQARILEDWAGLRPGTPDDLPILGATSTPGYFVATGHFRDGILLTPVTAHVMAQAITDVQPDYDISAFSPARF
jgi:glycine/D-amino acid oxidase-like deaminating enzyme